MGMQMMMLVVLALGAHSLIEYEAHSVTALWFVQSSSTQ